MERRQASAVFRPAANGLFAWLRAFLDRRKNGNGRKNVRKNGLRHDESALNLRPEMRHSRLFPSDCGCRSGSLLDAFIRLRLQGNDHGSVCHLSELIFGLLPCVSRHGGQCHGHGQMSGKPRRPLAALRHPVMGGLHLPLQAELHPSRRDTRCFRVDDCLFESMNAERRPQNGAKNRISSEG